MLWGSVVRWGVGVVFGGEYGGFIEKGRLKGEEESYESVWEERLI